MALGGNNLKLRCPMAICQVLEVPVPSPGVSAGEMYRYNNVVGVWVNDYDTGDTGVLIYSAPDIIVPCAVVTTSVNYDVGEPVYFDVADAEVNQTASSNWLCGHALVKPAVGDEEVEIALNGDANLVLGT